MIIPLLLLIFCYRSHIHNQCKKDIKCLKNNFIMKLNKLNNQIKNTDKAIEPFIGNITDWFSSTSSTNLPISSGIISNENLSILEKKINDNMKKSNTFPPSEINGNIDDFKDSDNSDMLKGIAGKPNVNTLQKPYEQNSNNKVFQPQPIFNDTKKNTKEYTKEETKEDTQEDTKEDTKEETKDKIPSVIASKKLDKKSLFGSCQFFNDKCPDKYIPIGNFSIQNIGNNNILTCGSVQNTKPGHAIAKIKNNAIYEIHITDPGHGFNPSSPPKISIEGGKGHGATAESVVDDDGYLKLIKVIHPGYNYTETPNILIDAPFMNSSCHLCCKDE